MRERSLAAYLISFGIANNESSIMKNKLYYVFLAHCNLLIRIHVNKYQIITEGSIGEQTFLLFGDFKLYEICYYSVFLQIICLKCGKGDSQRLPLQI